MDKIQTKFAFVAPKSVAKKAVDRNKLRRQGYYTLHSIKPLPKIYGIFFYKKGVKTYKYKDIKENIEFIINKIKE